METSCELTLSHLSRFLVATGFECELHCYSCLTPSWQLGFYFHLHFDLWVVVVGSKFGKDSEAVSGPGSLEKIIVLPCAMGGVEHCKRQVLPFICQWCSWLVCCFGFKR